MADEAVEEEDEPKKRSKLPLILGLVLMLVGGGGGFFAASTGMILGESEETEKVAETEAESDLPSISFVELDPLTIAINDTSNLAHLRFRAHLEVPQAHLEEVTLLKPRVVDILNSYLRALRTSDITGSSSLARLRAQMLRRVQVVLGPGRVNDLLIMEFVIN